LPDCGLPDCGLPDCGLPDCGLPDCGVDAHRTGGVPGTSRDRGESRQRRCLSQKNIREWTRAPFTLAGIHALWQEKKLDEAPSSMRKKWRGVSS
jgi:hypothetical protein